NLYAVDPEVRFLALEETKKALKNVIGYRLYYDLRRGWRVISPNLEQCGLLAIGYPSLRELCGAEDKWKGSYPALVLSKPEIRFVVSKTLLDLMRRELCIRVDYLDSQFQERIRQQSSQRLILPWALDENERLVSAPVLMPRSSRPGDYEGNYFLSPRGLFSQYLRRHSTFPDHKEPLNFEATGLINLQLLKVLKVAGLVEEVRPPENKDEVPGYQLPGSAIRWVAGDGTKPFHDILRVPTVSEKGGKTNPFFVEFYKGMALEAQGVKAHEHTAQVPYEIRIEREGSFREGRLPILYCSPTMELGIDISTLNVVNMRNIPPTPANYSQRSGRAGRSGQPALVFSYCSTGSPHDQYFFKRPEQMVAGVVTPPRLELANEDLIKAHVHAVWLGATGQSLGISLRDILDLDGENPSLDLLPSVLNYFKNTRATQEGQIRSRRILSTIEQELKSANWYSEDWVEDVLNKVTLSFNQAGERWRSLYRAAKNQRETQHKIISDASRSAEDKNQAKRLRREAEAQLELLLESARVMESDFYSYRYFANEGFLPGYNFPRLPLSAFIPGRRDRKEYFLSRPRFLAISEFGPRSIVYHEGSRYIINKVIMPVTEEGVLTTSAKLCPDCGYLHPISNAGAGVDLCEYCKNHLGPALSQLFRLQNVSTKRRDRINCDEEERLRMGYEIKTGVRFSIQGGKPSCQVATLIHPEKGEIAALTYCQSSTLWRINLGWTRRKNRNQYGFVLDTERGYWARNEVVGDEDDQDPMSANASRVIPFVEDHRNCLLFRPGQKLDENQMASLQSALKQAIQASFQLEDNELAAEPLPGMDNRQVILLYEAAEGGAGVLRQLLEDPNAFARVAVQALDLCHFDPATGGDRKKAPRAKDDCEAACYDCLLSYGNQRDHSLLDRKTINQILLDYARASVSVSPGGLSRAEHLQRLLNLAGSELEKRWLRYLADKNLHLPSRSQVFMEKCKTRPDFIYDDHLVVVYVDGPPHKYPERKERDIQQTSCLEDLGYTVIRFEDEEDWDKKIAQFPHVFGLSKGT
ncbi:MAG: DUF1998 domain-containing protein, partial [Proteobacteria bacterium]|nr:DUF1998 domain-containing protein [Pseudomonadota bacterium]